MKENPIGLSGFEFGRNHSCTQLDCLMGISGQGELDRPRFLIRMKVLDDGQGFDKIIKYNNIQAME